MHFYISRPMMDNIIIEADSVDELKFLLRAEITLDGTEFSDEVLDRVFNEKRRSGNFPCTDAKKCFYIMRLTKRDLKDIRTKVCPLCLKSNAEIYIPDDASMCDGHYLEKFDLRQYITYDTADCMGMEELLPADEVLKVLRRIT